MRDKNVWLWIKEFFDRDRDKARQRSDQEIIDLANDYKEMMGRPSWKDYEQNLKALFEEAQRRLDYSPPGIDPDQDYFNLKMAQERKQTLREVMYIPFVAIGQGHHKEKEKKIKENPSKGKRPKPEGGEEQ